MATAKTATTDDLSAQVETLKSDIAALTKTIADLTKAKGEEASDTLRARAESARATGDAQVAELQEQATQGMEAAEDYVRRNPATALGVAAGVGVLVGLLSARR